MKNLQWVIDRQKKDQLEIKKQARRYLLAAVSTLLVLIGLLLREGDILPTKDSITISLVESSFLWQLSQLDQSHADAVVDALYPITSVLLPIGGAILTMSLFIGYRIELSPNCEPIGNTGDITDKTYRASKWIKRNDELIEDLERWRLRSMSLGFVGFLLVLSSAFLRVVFMFSAFLYTVLSLIAIYYAVLFIRESLDIFSNFTQSILTLVLIWPILVSPVVIYTNITNSTLSLTTAIGYIFICLLLSLYMIRMYLPTYHPDIL